jgi:hypothetical protein
MSERPEPEYETYSCEEVGNAWQALRKQIERGEEPLVWTGPDRLHFHIAAGSPPPSHYLTPEGREHDGDQGRDIWDTLFLIAFQIGFHNGVMREGEHTAHYRRLLDIDMGLIEDANKRAKALQGVIDRSEGHLRTALGYREGQSDAGLENLSLQVRDRLVREDW